MALGDNELRTTASKSDSNKRVNVHRVKPKKCAAGAGDDATSPLPALTPMAQNSSPGVWGPWDANGANDTDAVKGFLAEEHQLDGTDETMANMIMRGDLHYADILAAVVERGVEVEADLLTELRTVALRELGLDISGLSGVP